MINLQCPMCQTALSPTAGSDWLAVERTGRGSSITAPHWRRGITLAILTFALHCPAATVIYDTAPYWPHVSGSFGGMGPDQSSTIGQTFVAPLGLDVKLNDFNFYAESYFPYNGGIANLHLRAFVYTWSGSLIGNGGAAIGNALYMSPSFEFSPPPRPGGWVPLTASIDGEGLALAAGQQYVMGFTLSDPTDYAASQGDIEFQCVPARNPNYSPPPIPDGVDFGGGSAVWINNENHFGDLNTKVWDTWGDIGPMAFTAHYTVVPEPSTVALTCLGTALWICWRTGLRRR